MPFPVIDRNRYWAYAGGISSLLVRKSKHSSSTLITTTFSQPTSATAPSETHSLSWWLTSSLTPTLLIANKYSKLTYLISTAT